MCLHAHAHAMHVQESYKRTLSPQHSGFLHGLHGLHVLHAAQHRRAGAWCCQAQHLSLLVLAWPWLLC
jgi:hypothetical protein